jgi:hypothetical protein
MDRYLEKREQEMKKVAQPLETINVDKESKNALKNQERFAEIFLKNCEKLVANLTYQNPLIVIFISSINQ